MAFSDGDFVKIEYNAWRVADNKLIYTTNKKVAQENGILDEEGRYVPQLIAIGQRNVIKGVEEAVKKMSLNETKKVEIEPKDAFGEKDPAMVKVLPLSDFKSRDIDPYPGLQLNIDGLVVQVKSVSSGRVIVDANNPFAGEKLLYEIKVVEKVEKEEDKIKAIAEMYAIKPDSVSVNGGEIKVKFGEAATNDEKYLSKKMDFINVVMSYMEKIKKVNVDETYERKETEKEREKA